jgi:hypothetical protein
MVKENLLKSLEVFPLSVPEYKKILIDDEDSPSFLKSIDQTGIPSLKNKLVDSKFVNNKEEVLAQYQKNLDIGLEGCILKNADAIWSSKRSNDYLKNANHL